MKSRTVSMQFLFNGLKNIRTANYDEHATTMHFIGYIGACLHLGGITAEQYLALFEMAQNAFNYRSRELYAMRSNQSNPIDLPDDPQPMECVECEEKFSPERAEYVEGVCPYCGFALTEDDDE